MATSVRLIYARGDKRGESVDIFPPGISIGREDDNDIVLDDDQVSRYHAKIEQYEDVWYIHDLDSRNGLFQNSKKIESHAPLSIHDELRIGGSSFIFADDITAVDLPPAAGAAPAEPTVAAPPAAAKKVPPRVIALGAGLAVAVIVVGGLLLAPSAKKPAQPRQADPGSSDPAAEFQPSKLGGKFEAYYEKLIASKDNVFRYELSVKDGYMKVAMDDLKNDWHISEPAKELPQRLLDDLAEEVLTTQFIGLAAVPPERGAEREVRERLMLRSGRAGNYIVLQNARAPAAFDEAVERLVHRASKEFYIPAVPASKEEILRLATKDFQVARELYDRAGLQPSNLYEAIVNLRIVQERLRWIDPKPDFFHEAYRLQQEAERVLDAKVKETMSAAVLDIRVKRHREALEKLREIVAWIPDREDPRHREAREEILRINSEEERQRRGRRKKKR